MASKAGDEAVDAGQRGDGWLQLIITIDCVSRDQVYTALACLPRPGVCHCQVCHGQMIVHAWATVRLKSACVDLYLMCNTRGLTISNSSHTLGVPCPAQKLYPTGFHL